MKFRYILTTKDPILMNLQPSMVIEDSNYHSGEVSESDAEKAQNEKDDMIRPSKKEDSNHVLYVYDKPWRSSKVCNNMFDIINPLFKF